MRDALDEQIEYFETNLPAIKSKGHGWALVADREHVKTFPVFSDAARYAREHYGKQQVLIRHTDERAVETAPYIQVHQEP